jgi:hypothetical protein
VGGQPKTLIVASIVYGCEEGRFPMLLRAVTDSNYEAEIHEPETENHV